MCLAYLGTLFVLVLGIDEKQSLWNFITSAYVTLAGRDMVMLREEPTLDVDCARH